MAASATKHTAPPEVWAEINATLDREAASVTRKLTIALKAARREVEREKHFNPHHEPGGSPEGGQFARALGGTLATDHIEAARGIADTLVSWGAPEADRARIEKNWRKQLKGRVVTDPAKLAVLRAGMKENASNETFMALVRAHGGEGVVVLLTPTADVRSLVGGERGHAAERRGALTAVYDKPHGAWGNEKLRPGISVASAAGGAATMLRHEFGHAVEERLDSATKIELADLYAEIKDPKEQLTYYAGRDRHEAFPEAIAIGTHPDYDPSDWAPEVAAYIAAVLRAASMKREHHFNPNHAPSGTPEGGQFISGASGTGEFASYPKIKWRERVTARDFLAARAKSKREAYLSPLTEDDLAGKRMFLSEDGTIGFLIDKDGDFQNLFNNGGPKNGGKTAIVHAIESGAKTGDCFDGYLPQLYSQFGFEFVSRIPFVDEYAPAGWNYERDGRPDVVFMVYTGGNRDTLRHRIGSFRLYQRGSGRRVAEYDQAKAIQQAAAGVRRSEPGGTEGHGAVGPRAWGNRLGRGTVGLPAESAPVHPRPVDQHFNPYHAPEGTPEGGQFTSAAGASAADATVARDLERNHLGQKIRALRDRLIDSRDNVKPVRDMHAEAAALLEAAKADLAKLGVTLTTKDLKGMAGTFDHSLRLLDAAEVGNEATKYMERFAPEMLLAAIEARGGMVLSATTETEKVTAGGQEFERGGFARWSKEGQPEIQVRVREGLGSWAADVALPHELGHFVMQAIGRAAGSGGDNAYTALWSLGDAISDFRTTNRMNPALDFFGAERTEEAARERGEHDIKAPSTLAQHFDPLQRWFHDQRLSRENAMENVAKAMRAFEEAVTKEGGVTPYAEQWNSDPVYGKNGSVHDPVHRGAHESYAEIEAAFTLAQRAGAVSAKQFAEALAAGDFDARGHARDAMRRLNFGLNGRPQVAATWLKTRTIVAKAAGADRKARVPAEIKRLLRDLAAVRDGLPVLGFETWDEDLATLGVKL